jgi:hypothetical protein
MRVHPVVVNLQCEPESSPTLQASKMLALPNIFADIGMHLAIAFSNFDGLRRYCLFF